MEIKLRFTIKYMFKLEKHLDKFLNYPKVCPHGTPLEDTSYIFDALSLDNIEVGEKTFIKRLEDEKEVLRFSKKVGLNIGDMIKMIENHEDSNIKIERSGIYIEINRALARKIYVK